MKAATILLLVFLLGGRAVYANPTESPTPTESPGPTDPPESPESPEAPPEAPSEPPRPDDPDRPGPGGPLKCGNLIIEDQEQCDVPRSQGNKKGCNNCRIEECR